MKFDIVRAWKDEAYRDTLSNAQRATLPANPAGELTDAEMELVCGGDGGHGGGAPIVAPAAPVVHHHTHKQHTSTVAVASAASSSVTRTHSYGLTCDINLFSLSIANNIISAQGLLSVLSPETQCCSSCD